MKTFADSHYLFEKGSPDGVNTFTSPDKFTAHWHRAGEILYLMPSDNKSKIVARVIVGDTLYEIGPGDIIFIPGQQIHEVPDGCKGNLMGLQYNTNVLSSQSEFLPYIRRFARIAILRRSEAPELTTYLIAKFEEIRSMNNADERFKRIKSAMILCECFMAIADFIDNKYAVDDSSVSPSAILAINRVCEYVKDNLTKDPSLENAAKYVGLCTSYLSRTFKQVLGISYTDYVNRNKVSLAISLMASDDYSITEICYLSGFNSISSFNRVFLNVTGLTPRKFRKYTSGQSLNNTLQ